jgi:hypothetical protein
MLRTKMTVVLAAHDKICVSTAAGPCVPVSVVSLTVAVADGVLKHVYTTSIDDKEDELVYLYSAWLTRHGVQFR